MSVDKSPLVMDVNILDLPDRTLEGILTKTSYADLVTLRQVCPRFQQVCGRLLNAGFLGLEAQLRFQLDNVQSHVGSSRAVGRVLSRYKILQILDSEYRALRCLCGRLVNLGRYCFTGGDILDHFYDVLRADTNEVSETIERHVTVTVAMRCEEFADHFEAVEAPPRDIIDFSFGSDVVNLVDCFLNSNYHLIATPDDETDSVHIAGCYEIFSSREGVLTPPVIAHEDSHVASPKQIRLLLRYLRNAGRWHNLCHCINTSSRVQKRRLRLCLDDPVTCKDAVDKGDCKKLKQRVFKRNTCVAHDQEDCVAGMTCALELRCARILAPRRVASSSASVGCEVPEMAVARNHAPFSYEFSVELKVHYPVVEGTTEIPKENVIMVFQTEENCLIRQVVNSFSSP